MRKIRLHKLRIAGYKEVSTSKASNAVVNIIQCTTALGYWLFIHVHSHYLCDEEIAAREFGEGGRQEIDLVG